MSGLSVVSTESSSSRTVSRVDGVPRQCWCGQRVEVKLSKSEHNPNRRFFKCSFAAANRLKDDKHIFKWMDEAILSEIGILESKIESLDSKIMSLGQELSNSRLELEKRLLEFQSDVLERVDSVLLDARAWMKKLVVVQIVVVVVGCITFTILA